MQQWITYCIYFCWHPTIKSDQSFGTHIVSDFIFYVARWAIDKDDRTCLRIYLSDSNHHLLSLKNSKRWCLTHRRKCQVGCVLALCVYFKLTSLSSTPHPLAIIFSISKNNLPAFTATGTGLAVGGSPAMLQTHARYIWAMPWYPSFLAPKPLLWDIEGKEWDNGP